MADIEYNADEAAGTCYKYQTYPVVYPCRFALQICFEEDNEEGKSFCYVGQTGYTHILFCLESEIKKKRAFRKFSYRGIDLDQLLDLSSEQLRDVVHARARRRFNRGLKRKPMGLIKKLRRAKQEAKPNEKPDLVKTHLRDMIVVPEMIGSVIGIYSGKEFNQVEIKPEMVGHYLGEFSISYKPVKHGRPGIGATHSSRFIPLK
ncbi:40S ribosomal protein S15 [Paracoccidioides brasiliensis]|uniref:40S ribosomal protein S15 n=1 Tax=Paracoccidioides brasiliensis TaxID=121759 RepID=A0A1D2JKL6_PARBR|nr:40S ribosomal protein S15 [Paracoccidioides brasiliensis]